MLRYIPIVLLFPSWKNYRMKLFTSLMTLVLIISCGKQGTSNLSKVTFSFSNPKEISRIVIDNRWSDGEISATSEIACVGIIYTNPNGSTGSCSSFGSVVFDYTDTFGTVSSPGTGGATTESFTFTTEKGSGHEFKVIAFEGSGACPDLQAITSGDQTNFQFPYVVAEGTFDLVNDIENIAITVDSSTISSKIQFDSCSGTPAAFTDANACQGSETGHSQRGSGTTTDPYRLCTMNQIQDLANSGSGNWGAEFILTDDIDLTGISLATTIGNSGVSFTGAFRGNGKTLSNLSVDVSNDDTGLFGVVENGAEIGNFTISNASFNIIGTVNRTGTVIGKVDLASGSISNITVANSSVTVSGATVSEMGGIIGQLTATSASTIKTLNVDNLTVTIASGSTITTVGGVIGKVLGGTISETLFSGSLDFSQTISAAEIGGVIGKVNNVSSADVTISEASSTGSFSFSDEPSEVGGIVGLIENNGGNVVLEDCRARNGTITVGDSPHDLGGVLGEYDDLGSGTMSLARCYSDTAISTGGNAINIGGIVGSFTQSSGSATIDQVLYAGSSITIISGSLVDYVFGQLSGSVTNTNNVFSSVITATCTSCAASGTDSGLGIGSYQATSSESPFSGGSWPSKFSDGTWVIQSGDLPILNFELGL